MISENNLSLSVVDDKDENLSKKFICVFQDNTSVRGNARKFHLNLPVYTTVQDLYSQVAEKSSYKNGTFLLMYTKSEEEEIIDLKCDDTLLGIIGVSNDGRHNFKLINKDENGPVTLIMDSVTIPNSKSDTDLTVNVGTFFDEQEEKAGHTKTSSHTSFENRSLKSDTGFVGLVNQAMTCYLNSLLQTLFMTPEFRNALYRWRYHGNHSNKSSSIPYQLQKLFLKLETSKKRAIETKELTKSFGWDTSEAWQQHDVQELCRVMFDALEETLKGTDEANLINKLYQGCMKDYVKCLECAYESSREDHFLDISLDVRPFGSTEPFKNLEESLKAFVEPDKLDGSNQYFCEKCNAKQDAHKGLKFTKFPYLLTIQFKRFTYDLETAQRIKLHDRLTFPNELNLTQFVKDQSDTTEKNKIKEKQADNDEKSPIENHIQLQNGTLEEPEDEEKRSTIENGEVTNQDDNIYELFSMLIHSGSAQGGHYYAYIKNFENDTWYCFNDMYVTQVSTEELEKAYGGTDKYTAGFYSKSYQSSTSAYMVMYRRKDCHNANFNKKSTWSKSLTNLCNVVLQDEMDEHTRRERQKDMCNLKLFCFHPETNKKLERKLELHKDTALNEATEIARKICDIEDLVSLGNCRLVKYNDYSDSFERSYEGEEETPVGKLLGGVRLTYDFDFLLELKTDFMDFPVYQPGGCTLRVFLLDLTEEEFVDKGRIHAPLSTTIQQLKEILAMEYDLDERNIVMAVYKKYNDFEFLKAGHRTLKMQGYYRSEKLFVGSSFGEDHDITKFQEMLELYKNTVNISVHLPVVPKNGTNKELNLRVDKRITLQDFKVKISHAINVETHMFRVFRSYSENQEYEFTKLEESLSTYIEQAKIVVKLGRALQIGEYRSKIFLLDVNKDEHFTYFTDVVIWSGLKVGKLKEEQINPELKKQNVDFTPERVRLRKKNYKYPSRVYTNDNEFDKEITLGTVSEFFIEILEEAEVITSEDYLSLYARQWCPSELKIKPFEEIILYKDTTVAALLAKIEAKHNIPQEHILVAKGKGYFPCNVSVLDIEEELHWYSDGTTKLGTYPFSIEDDGCIVYFKDNREVLKTLSEEERSSIKNSEKRNSNKYISSYKAKEKALKIYTDKNR